MQSNPPISQTTIGSRLITTHAEVVMPSAFIASLAIAAQSYRAQAQATLAILMPLGIAIPEPTDRSL
jgi:hypothetical protein